MKLDNKKIEIVGSIGEESYEATISQEDISKMWDMLQNPYKNNIGSIVREITSNCFDSHAEAKVTDAVRITYGKEDSGLYVSFNDVGVGLSPDRIKSIFTKYLKSTKENSNDFIGAFGIGSKSPLSYQDYFYINTIFNNVEYNYIMRKGEKSPVVDLLKKKITNERNGTEIKIIIKNENDLEMFLKETINQLAYFDNVDINVDTLDTLYSKHYYNYSDSVNKRIKNAIDIIKTDYKIIKGENFIYRTEGRKYNELHLAIGTVSYPIDWANLGMPAIMAPLALKFNIGELSVIQTREDIRYIDENIEKIKNKIKDLKKEITDIAISELNISNLSFVNFMTTNRFNDSSFINIKVSDNESYEIIVPNLIDKSKLPAVQLKGFNHTFESLSDNSKFQSALKQLQFYVRDHNIVSNTNGDMISNYIHLEKSFRLNGALKSEAKNHYNTFNCYSRNLDNIITHTETKKNQILENSGNYILVDPDTKYTTKKNKYIYNKLNLTNAIFISSKIDKFNVYYLKEVYKYQGNSFKNVMSFKTFAIFIYKLFNELLSDLKTELVSYSDIKIDDVWWKKYKDDNKKNVDYDRSLIAITRSETITPGSYDRLSYRPSFHNYINDHKFRILINKDDQDKFVTNSHDYNHSNLENFVTLFNKMNYLSTNYNVSKKSTLLIDVVSNRNYNKIIENRNDRSNIFTPEEFINNKVMQKRHLKKFITNIAILRDMKENQQIAPYGKNFNSLPSCKFIFNNNVQDLINQLSFAMDNYESIYHSVSRLNFSHLIYTELDNITLDDDILDQDMIKSYKDLLEILINSNFMLVANSYVSNALIIKNYIPNKSSFRFNNIFYKKRTKKFILETAIELNVITLDSDNDINDDDVINKYYDILLKNINFNNKLGFPNGNSYRTDNNVIDNNLKDNVKLIVLLIMCYNLDNIDPYSSFNKLSNSIIEKPIIEKVVEEGEKVEEINV